MAIIGIDLGTTFCAVATLDERGKATTVPNRDGDILTPSAVYLSGTGEAVIGQPALDLALEKPANVATLVKRRMGYPDFGRAVAGREFRPETLSAILLRKLAQDAEQQLGRIRGVVITVPAYFDDTRRQATMDAGRIAGLNVLDILDEPSAAALAYTLQQGSEIPATAPKHVLVYDLGGGTFDVTLVKLSKKRFEVLAIEGDVRLGGKDWDDRLVNHAAEQFQQHYGTDPRSDEQSLVHLQAAAERVKRTLSKVDQTTLTIMHDGRKYAIPVTRADFENWTRDLLLRTRLTTQQVLAQTKLSWPEVDQILLVGGSTHMPMTGRMLQDLTGKLPDRSLAVSEVVARGAAIHAGIVANRHATRPEQNSFTQMIDVVEVTVNAHSLGVEIRQGDDRLNNKLVAKNTQLPAAASRVYFTTQENQTRVRVRILQGEASQAAACIPVGECWIEGLPPNLPKKSPIQVRCGVTASGRVEVMALDMTSGQLAQAVLHRTGGLDEDQLLRESAWVKGLNVQ
ncbi:MAG: Hsp70 family protein [Gemmataceae bacterium]